MVLHQHYDKRYDKQRRVTARNSTQLHVTGIAVNHDATSDVLVVSRLTLGTGDRLKVRCSTGAACPLVCSFEHGEVRHWGNPLGVVGPN